MARERTRGTQRQKVRQNVAARAVIIFIGEVDRGREVRLGLIPGAT